MKNIIETSILNTHLSTLVTALKSADLVDTLSGDGPFTVFAPTNEAFAKIPEETLQKLLADKAKLTTLLSQHVVSEKLTSEDLATKKEIMTLALPIVTKEGVTVGKGKVTQADIECSNGVIHLIDTVLQ